MPPTTETPLQRLHRIFAIVADKAVRDLFLADRKGEPPARVLEFAREMAIRECEPPAPVAASMAALSDEEIGRAFTSSFAAKIARALAEIRPS